MALPWKEILTLMPWQKVLDNAPQIVGSARKLWSRKSGMPDGEAFAPSSEAERLESLALGQEELRGQFQEAGRLLAALSEQNAQLIAEVEKLRRRARRQDWALIAIALLLLAFFAFALARPA